MPPFRSAPAAATRPESEQMNDSSLDDLMREFDLRECDLLLLELIPLIEVIWADGENQEAELKLLYRFTIEHLARMSRDADGEELVTVDQVNSFLDRFAHQPPDPELLKRLRAVAVEHLDRRSESTEAARERRSIMDYCLDIAAACTTHYPYGSHDRVMAAEKLLLRDLMSELRISTEQAPDACA